MEKDKYLLSSVNNTLSLIELLSHYDSLSLAEIVKLSGFDKASCFRMLYTLETNDMVIKTSDSRYQLGLSFIRYGAAVSSRLNLVNSAKPLMKEAADRHKRSLHLGIIDGNRVLTILVENPVHGLAVSGRIGMSAKLYATGMGRVLLSGMDDRDYADYTEHLVFKHYSDHSIHSKAELDQIIDSVRNDGYATDIDDRFPGFGAIAVPIKDGDKQIIAALSIISTADNISNNINMYYSELNELALSISKSLGS